MTLAFIFFLIRKNYKRYYGKEVTIMKIKIDPAKALSITVTALGVVGTLLSAKVAKNDQAALKAELKDELMKELQNK